MGIQGNQKRQSTRMLCVTLSAAQTLTQQYRGTRTGVRHVDVWIRSIGHQRIGHGQHALGHVGMQIQTGHDRHRWPDQRAHTCQQFTFAVVGVFRHGRSVQIQVHAIQPLHTSRPHVLHNRLTDTLESLLRDIGGRRSTGPGRRHQLPALAAGRIDKASHRQIQAGELLHHRLPTHKGRKTFTGVEGRPIGETGRKCVGLVLITGDQNTGHVVKVSRAGNGAGAASSRRRV